MQRNECLIIIFATTSRAGIEKAIKIKPVLAIAHAFCSILVIVARV